MNAKRWILRGHDADRVASLARVLNISPIVASLLISRGCGDERSARAFLRPRHDQLHDPRPVFMTHNLRIMSEPRLIGEKHLKMHVGGLEGRPLETIWWNGAATEQSVAVTSGITMAYTIEANRWGTDTFLQLSVQEMRPAFR